MIILFVVPGLVVADESVEKKEEQSKKYSEAEIDSMSIELLKQVADEGSIEHNSPLALYYLGIRYKQNNETAMATDSFKQLLSKYSLCYLAPKACLELALLYNQKKDYISETEVLNRMIKAYPDYLDTNVGIQRLAIAYKNMKKIDDMHKTLDTLETRLGSSKEAVPSLFMSANEYLTNLNVKKAIEKFDKLLAISELTPKQKAQALLGKAAVHEYAAQTEEAEMMYNEIIKMEQIDKAVIEMAEKSKINLKKAPMPDNLRVILKR
jgi:tetratricopeptide (TPR) repeat protein